VRCVLFHPRCKAVRERIFKRRLLGRRSHACGGASSTSPHLLAHQAQVSLIKLGIRFFLVCTSLRIFRLYFVFFPFTLTWPRVFPNFLSFFQAKEQARRSWMVSRAFKAKIQGCSLCGGDFDVRGLAAFFGTVCCLSCLLQWGAVRHW
jgi:hypothetical protein